MAFARALIHGLPPHIADDAVTCAVCDQPCAAGSVPLGKVVSDNFTTWDLVRGDRGAPVCAGCVSIFRDFKWRSTALLARPGAEAQKMDGPAFRALLLDPPAGAFVLTWPATRKKHCWLHAGLSTAATLRIGCDDQCVQIARTDALRGLELVELLFGAGATKAEVKIGMYRPLVSQRIGTTIEDIEAELQPLRASGALDILVWATPREQGAGAGDIVMLTENEKTAAELLARLANGAMRRDADPIGFWGTGYLSRLQRRLAAPTLLHFIERLAADIDVRSTDLRRAVDWIESLSAEQQAALLPTIKTSPRVMVAMAQDKAKSLRPGASRRAETAIPAAGAADLNDPFPWPFDTTSEESF